MGKNLYITTAIPYANAKPHIGNALDYLLADIWSRYQKQNGRTVRFQVGTDEHGNKIAAKAAEAGLEPKAYTDQMVGNFVTLMQKVGAEYTDFVRTTDDHHVAAVQWIWQQLAPYIYKGTYEGWYCTGHEAFFTDILKLRLPRNLTGQQTGFIREARNFWSLWKTDGSLVLLQNK